MENLIFIAVYLLLGLALQRVKQFPQNTGQVLNLYVIYIALPALVLQKIPALTFSSALIIPALLPWLLLALVVPLILLLAKRFHWSRGATGALLICIPLGNTSFLGLPMIEAFYGAEALPYGVLYDQLGSFLGLAIYATIIAAVYSDQQTRPSAWQITHRIVIFPPFIALVAAFGLRGFSYTPVLQSMIDTLAATLVPVIMIAVGFQLKFRLARHDRNPLLVGLLLKLVAMPLLAIALLVWTGFDDVVVQVSIFEAAMPPMISAGAVAIMAGLAPSLSAALVGYGILFCFLTLPLVYQLLLYLNGVVG